MRFSAFPGLSRGSFAPNIPYLGLVSPALGPRLSFPAACRVETRRGQAQIIFDRHVKKLQRDRAGRHPKSRDTDYLKDEVAERMVDRLLVGYLDGTSKDSHQSAE